ncbi:chymotrypsin-like elastase family member 2A isoform X2 [Hypomesus transpacificus]|nr:chymotrypsin-like elastase family member 2A isoform X2 [Hypomesus transpacificus]
MLKLRTPVTFSDSIKPACLPKFEQILPHDTPCYVTGWGRLSTNGAGADILQQALLPIVEHATCKKNDWWSVMVTDKMVCAGGDGERSGCFGDSGGPLNCQNPDGSWAVHGVFSFGSGQGCNVVKKPSVFTRISTFVDWIEDILNPPKPDGCGVPTFPPSTSRVVGGVDVREHSWPWQVSLQYDLSGFHHSCGATLLSEEWIMTAAHCITSGRIYKVYLGKHSLKDDEAGSEFISVAKVIYHPKWVSSSGINDLAMLKLRTPVTFSDSIKPACLPKFEQILPHDTPCYVTGWGRLSTNGDNTDILQQALLPIVEHATCKKNDWWSVMVTDKMVCAGGDGERSGCFGDSGGPLNCQNPDGSWVVHGVFSFGSGQGCNVVKKPSVYTRTSAYVDWINRIMTQH